MDQILHELAPLRHPVAIALIVLSVVASCSRVAIGRRGWVLSIGTALAVMTGAICLHRDWLLQRLVLLIHPVSIVLIVIAGFVWLASRSARKKGLLLFLGLIVGLAAGERYSDHYLSRNPYLRRQRTVLATMDDETQAEFMNCVPHPYLLYVQSPSYKNGKNWHNQDGYRGATVPIERTPGIARVLCLGGSTTYGIGTEDPEDAYPAILEKQLNGQVIEGSRSVEVINGGLPSGTTAELIGHYQFKYQYYAPDVVVINTGGNDAFTQSAYWHYYQPDYTHRRQPFSRPLPLSPLGRSLLKSAFASVLILQLNLPASLRSSMERDRVLPPPVPWHPAAKEPGRVSSLTDDQLAFTRNLKRLIQMVQADGGDVVLVPFRVAPGGETEEPVEQCDRNERILKELALDGGHSVAPFPQDCISSANWIDSCHLNADGCREKAEHIMPFVRDVLTSRARNSRVESDEAQ